MKGRRLGALIVVLLGILGPMQAQAPMSMQAQGPVPADSQPRVHTYYIAADEVSWNYALNALPLMPSPENEIAFIPHEKSTVYLKAVYHEYTDGTFQTLKPRPPEWEHLGILGPLIRAEVGDVVKIVFKNNTRMIVTMHPHGLDYDKDSEGAFYSQAAGTPPDRNNKGDAVHRGEVFTYTWTVPERAGPGPMDPSSILWMYHSHFNESRDMNSGLLGPIIVSRKGSTKPDGTPKDVDREFVVAFANFQESSSGFFMQNIVHDQKYPATTITDPNFVKTLEYYTMNGFIKGTMPLLTMKKGERVRWYMMANTNEDDVHAPHWHGQTVLFNSMRMDSLSHGTDVDDGGGYGAGQSRHMAFSLPRERTLRQWNVRTV